jgi:hypothetical protein
MDFAKHDFAEASRATLLNTKASNFSSPKKTVSKKFSISLQNSAKSGGDDSAKEKGDSP